MKKEHAAGILIAHAKRMHPYSTTSQMIATALKMGADALLMDEKKNVCDNNSHLKCNKGENPIDLLIEKFLEDSEKEVMEDGDVIVAELNNCHVVLHLDGNTLKEHFIGGKPYKVDETLSIFKNDMEEEEC